MKITKIEIYGYGKWLHKEFDSLQDMQIFLGNNEAGKSTLSSFIHTMFFGFPSARKKDTNSYEPKKGEAYGGKIFLAETRFGTIMIERMKEKNRGKATLTYESGKEEVVDSLAAYLLGVDRETYELLYTFKIDSLLDLNKVKKNDLNRHLLSVGTTGSEKLLQLADDYRKEAQKEFKPTGTVPLLNKKIQQAENLLLKLEQAKQKNSTYESFLLEASHIQEKIEAIHLLQKELEKDNLELSESIRLNDYYQEWLLLNKKIKEIDTSVLPKDAHRTWERLQSKISDDLQIQTTYQERIHHLTKQKEEYTHVEWFNEHQKELTALQHEIPQVTAQFNRKQFIQQTIEKIQLELQQLKREMGLEEEKTMEPLDEEKRNEAEMLLKKEEELLEKKNQIQQQLDRCESQLKLVEQRIEDVKPNLMGEDVFQEWQKQAELPKSNPSVSTPTKRNKTSIIVAILLVILVGLVRVFVPSAFLYTLLFSVALLIIVGFITFKNNNEKNTEIQSRPEEGIPFSMQTYIQQATLRERFSEWKIEEENDQEQLIQLLNLQEETEMQLEEQNEKQKEWLQTGGYPLSFTVQKIVDEDPGEIIAKKRKDLEENQHQLESLEKQLENWKISSAFVREHFGLEHLSEIEFLNQFAEIHQSVVLEESMSRNIQDKFIEVKRELDEVQVHLKENQEKRKQILQKAHVQTEAEFYQLLHAKEEQSNQKRRRDFLGEQLVGKEEILKKYPQKESAERLLKENQEKLQNLQSELKTWQRKEVSTRHEIDVLEKGGTYSSLLQDYAMLETEMREMIVEWGSKVIAAEWIEETLREGRNDRLPLILDDMNAYFILLTDHVYSRIAFQKSGLKVQHKDGTIFKPHELSQGTIEQLYIAMRFAFIKNTSDIANLPILIDDSFVNFDETRKQAMFSLMQELSETVQIFFFTFDKNVYEVFTNEQVYMLH